MYKYEELMQSYHINDNDLRHNINEITHSRYWTIKQLRTYYKLATGLI